MLAVKNLTKFYQVKGGVKTCALDNVSLTFPQTGMVFLLGKSGSGKSTLLNICGGLDGATSGEIIVNGKSLSNFSEQDFDSYRNTFIGFVFQEYNILNDITVEDNIAIALELQGKSKDKNEIDALLEQVDLSGYAKRKPNTLSGGQKQRIVIARALVKNPQIIMADEPTGALDSATGKQVLETLKKLSREKLVIVVSHDREFAEQYGDRIIELKDGKVIRDVTKKIQNKKLVASGKVSVIGKNTLSITDGKNLTDDDYAVIKEFISVNGDAIITNGADEIDNFKKVNRINRLGQKEVFLPTKKESATESQCENDCTLIRSKLPLKRAVKIGVSSLKVKPVRLILTILLCLVAFTMFGLSSTLMLYDEQAILKESIQNSNINYLVAKKEYQIRQYTSNGEQSYVWEYYNQGKFTSQEVDEQKLIYGKDAFGGVQIDDRSIYNLSLSSASGKLYQNASLTYLAHIPSNSAIRNNLLAGSYPTQENQVCISSYLAHCLIKNGFNDEQEKPASLQEVVGKSLQIRLNAGADVGETQFDYQVAGVFDCGYEQLLNEYPTLISANASQVDVDKQNSELEDFTNKYLERLYGVIFVSETLLQKEIDKKKEYDNILNNPINNQVNTSLRLSFNDGQATAYFIDASKISPLVKVYGKNTLNKGEAIITCAFIENNYDLSQLLTINNKSKALGEWLDALKNNAIDDLDGGNEVAITQDERAQILLGLMSFVNSETLSAKPLVWSNGQNMGVGEGNNISIVGITDDSALSYTHSSILVDNQTYGKLLEMVKEYMSVEIRRVETKYVESENASFDIIMMPYDHSTAVSNTIHNFSYEFSTIDDTRVFINNYLAQEVYGINKTVDGLSTIFIWVGVALAVFSSLLLCNFISVSISSKKKDIGILRAVGARGVDVFKIFYAESLAITLICIICSLVVSIVTCGVLNAQMGVMLSGVSLFVFGPLSIAVLIGIAMFTATISTFLPVYFTAKKKPIESIKEL